MLHRIVVIAGLLLVTLHGHAALALSQAVTPDDIAAVMLSTEDLPGFHLAGDGSPAPRENAQLVQRTRVFLADDAGPSGYTLLIEIMTVPTENALCLPYLPGNIAGGAVLGTLNGFRPNFAPLDRFGVGDVDTAATWNDVDGGTNAVQAVAAEVFMRGQVTVYLTYRTTAATIDPGPLAGFAQAQDALLQRAAAAGSPTGLAAITPVPAPSAERPALCGT